MQVPGAGKIAQVVPRVASTRHPAKRGSWPAEPPRGASPRPGAAPARGQGRHSRLPGRASRPRRSLPYRAHRPIFQYARAWEQDASSQQPLVLRAGPQRLSPPGLDAPWPAGLGVYRPPADRDRQHRLGPDAVQPAPDRRGRERQAGRLGGRRHPAEPADGLAGRDATSARRPCCSATWPRWPPRSCCGPTRSTPPSCSAAATRPSRPWSWARRRSTCRRWWCRAGRC